MSKAKAKTRVAKPVAQDGIEFDEASTAFCCGLTEIGQFEIHKGFYEIGDGEEYSTRKKAEDAAIESSIKYFDSVGEKWTAKDRAAAVAEVTISDVQDQSDDVPFKATFATTNSIYQQDVEEKLPKLGFKVVAAWKNNSRQTIKLWFKKPDGQKTVRIS